MIKIKTRDWVIPTVMVVVFTLVGVYIGLNSF